MKQFPLRRPQRRTSQNTQAKRGPRSSEETTQQPLTEQTHLEHTRAAQPPEAGTKFSSTGYSIARIPIFPPQGAEQAPPVPHTASLPSLAARTTHQPDQTPNEQSPASVLRQAQTEHTHELDEAVRSPLEGLLHQKLGQVKLHRGPTAAQLAQALNARAFTVGRDIYLGAQVPTLQSQERKRLLTHEAVHTIQQGGQPVALQGSLRVSHPGDPAEAQAEQIAETLTHTRPLSRSLTLRDRLRTSKPSPSHSLALRDRLRDASGSLARIQPVSPLIQRDIVKKESLANGNGDFDLNFTQYSLRRRQQDGSFKPETGLKGDITFTPSNTSPPGDNIKLLQTSKVTLTGGAAEYKWTGTEAQRENVRTTGAGGGDAGYFVDTGYGPYAPRTLKTDKAISPYYIDLPNGKQQGGQEGYHKAGPLIQDATLHDEPSIEVPAYFRYETIAKDVTTGTVYGGVRWSFYVQRVARYTNRKVDNSTARLRYEKSNVINAQTNTFDEAVKNFDEYFKNPGSTKAP